MPYLKGNNAEASKIYKEYETGSNQQSFLRDAREFLERERANPSGSDSQPNSHPPSPSNGNVQENGPSISSPVTLTAPSDQTPVPPFPDNYVSPPPQSFMEQRTAGVDPTALFQQTSNGVSLTPNQPSQVVSFSNGISQPMNAHREDSSSSFLQMSTIEQGLDAILTDDPILPTAGLSSIWGAPTPSAPPQQAPRDQQQAITPPRSAVSDMHSASPARTPPSPWAYNGANGPAPPSTSGASTPVGSPPKHPDSDLPVRNNLPLPAKDEPSILPQKIVKKEPVPPRRVWTHCDEQPGKILVNGCSGDDSSIVLSFAPRDELTAHWCLSLGYLRNRA